MCMYICVCISPHENLFYLSVCIYVYIFDRVIVSTDSREIANISLEYGASVPFLRPNYLSKDSSSSRSVIIHALHYFYKNFSIIPKYVGLKPPTNPFVKAKSIEGVIERLQKSNNQINSCVTISEASTHPFRILSLIHI